MEDLELEEGDRSYEIEKLLCWRWIGPSGRRRKREFLILWKQYLINDACWIPGSNFDDPTEIPKMMERDKHVTLSYQRPGGLYYALQ